MRGALAFGMLMALPVSAETPVVTAGGEIDVGFGRDGVTEISAYVDAERGSAYATLSLLHSGYAPDNEIDLAFGYFMENQGFSYDLGYRYARFPDDPGADYGEFALGVEASTDGLALRADLGFDPSADVVSLALGMGAEVSLSDQITAKLDLSAEPLLDVGSVAIGFDYALAESWVLTGQIAAVRDEGQPWESQWQAGLGWTIAQNTRLDLRYLGGNAPDRGYFALAISWDSGLSSD